MSYINTYTFFLNSAYRTSGSNAQPTWLLDRGLALEDPGNQFHARVLSAEIPFSFMTLNASYNTLPYLFTVTQLSINTSGTIVIHEGNYTILTLLSTLADAISTQMTAKGFAAVNQPVLNFTYDSTTGRASFNYSSAPAGFTVAFSLRWSQNDLLSRFFGMLATSANTVISYTSAAVNTSSNTVSVISVNVNPITSVVLRSDLLQQSATQMERYVEQGWAASNIVAKTFVTSGSNTWLFFQNDGFTVRLHNKTIESVDLYLTGLTFDPLLLNGISWNVVLQIDEWEPRIVQFNREQQLIRAYERQTRLEDLQRERLDLQVKVASSMKKIRGSIKQDAPKGEAQPSPPQAGEQDQEPSATGLAQRAVRES